MSVIDHQIWRDPRCGRITLILIASSVFCAPPPPPLHIHSLSLPHSVTCQRTHTHTNTHAQTHIHAKRSPSAEGSNDPWQRWSPSGVRAEAAPQPREHPLLSTPHFLSVGRGGKTHKGPTGGPAVSPAMAAAAAESAGGAVNC